MTDERLVSTLCGARAFLYIRASDDVHVLRRRQSLLDFADGLGIRVLQVFVDRQPSDSAASEVFAELLDALWRNDGVLLILDEPAQLSPEAATQRSCRARINATAAHVLYAHG